MSDSVEVKVEVRAGTPTFERLRKACRPPIREMDGYIELDFTMPAKAARAIADEFWTNSDISYVWMSRSIHSSSSHINAVSSNCSQVSRLTAPYDILECLECGSPENIDDDGFCPDCGH